MPEAYVLLNCELGSEDQIMNTLSGYEGVKEVRGVFGAYDVLARLESPQVEMLNDIIRTKIRKLKQIRGSLTLLTIEGQNKILK